MVLGPIGEAARGLIARSVLSQFLNKKKITEKGGFVVSVRIDNLDSLENIRSLGANFESEAAILFMNLVFEAHKYLIRTTPVQTGKLRGGWTSYLDANQHDYSDQIRDISLVADKNSGTANLDESKIQEGRSDSSYEDPNPFSVTLINAVPYGAFLEEGTSKIAPRSFVSRARYKAEAYMTERFDRWVRTISDTGQIPDVGLIVQEISP